jgi:hypothetical protein
MSSCTLYERDNRKKVVRTVRKVRGIQMRADGWLWSPTVLYCNASFEELARNSEMRCNLSLMCQRSRTGGLKFEVLTISNVYIPKARRKREGLLYGWKGIPIHYTTQYASRDEMSSVWVTNHPRKRQNKVIIECTRVAGMFYYTFEVWKERKISRIKSLREQLDYERNISLGGRIFQLSYLRYLFARWQVGVRIHHTHIYKYIYTATILDQWYSGE